MDQNERRMIEDLFAKLSQAERQAGPRDREAEQEIAQALGRQPAAPYYMAQVILMQEQAVRSLGERVQKLEQELAERPAGGGSFLGGLFGGGSGQSASSIRPGAEPPPTAPTRGWTNQAPAPERVPAMPPGANYGAANGAAAALGNRGGFGASGGSGFLGSAMQTAAGVAGGMLLANAVSGLFGGQAHAAGLDSATAEAQAAAAKAEAAASEAQAAAARADADADTAGAWPPDDAAAPDDLYADNGGDFDTFGDF
jgi:uncharacterized protein